MTVCRADTRESVFPNAVVRSLAALIPPSGTAEKIDAKGCITVMPFIIKGLLAGKAKRSPFLAEDGQTPIVPPMVLSLAERNAIRQRLGC